MFIKQFIRDFFDFLIPNRCNLCSEIDKKSICEICFKSLEHNQNYCYQCGIKLSKTSLCGNCIKQPQFFDLTISPFRYENKIAKLIHQAKFSKDLSSQRALSDLLLNHIKNYYLSERLPKAIFYVPAYPFWQRIRGFNFAQIIASDLSKSLDIPIFHLVKKCKNTPPQHSLNRKQRLSNVHNAFDIDAKMSQKIASINHIALVDDVMTTGATLNEISKQIKSKTNIKKIDIWILARTS